MQTKKSFSTELAYLVGIIILAFGSAFMEKADFGMSMVVAPAYLLHLKISEYLPFYTFGMSEYVLQIFVLIALALIMGKFKKGYLFSFLTAVFYGTVLDLSIKLVSYLPLMDMPGRFLYYFIGIGCCAVGISLLFHTYIPPEAYDLFVKELAAKTGKDINKVKTVYDICSCTVGVILSFLFYGFGHFVGVKAGTIFCALINGWLISQCSKFFESRFTFEDKLPWRKFFTE
ncbi:MAG: hypothetical protein IJI57_06895 [Flexilinea sp.]|nr:hypothetical protein [Flexilinea sp.]